MWINTDSVEREHYTCVIMTTVTESMDTTMVPDTQFRVHTGILHHCNHQTSCYTHVTSGSGVTGHYEMFCVKNRANKNKLQVLNSPDNPDHSDQDSDTDE